ncbi:MAG: PD-(D/E)XK nuclease family protein, partial [Chlamydiia bacterium]|nr:PD-(D/E)XK nuclease family protein [Chlamydiia bacterium]
EVGVAFHSIFERLFSAPTPIWRGSAAILDTIRQELRGSSLLVWEADIYALIDKTLQLPLPPGFTLRDIEPSQVLVEMEFLFPEVPHYLKGFIDLVFCMDGVYYFADWKSNYLGNHSPEQIMDTYDYWLQASLYGEALRRYLPNQPYGGAFYFFLREGKFLHFLPQARHG